VCLPGCSSLPFSHSCCSSRDRRVGHTHGQIPFVWPYSSAPRTILQEKLSRILNSTASNKSKTSLLPSFTIQGKVSELSVRWFSSSSNDDTDSDAENDENDESDNCERENKGAIVKSTADPAEVHKVCKVIDELFALDHNMEAVLDECGINLSHDLVIEVLERFRHARKPAFRFFCWAAEKPGFVHDSRTYHSMMIILAKARQFETMMSMLEEMGEKRLLTLDTFSIAMRAFAAAKERKKAVGIFELMKNHKYRVGVETINALLDSLGRAKLGKEAQALFGKLEGRFTPNLRTYTVLLNGWCRVKNLMEAGRIWNEMLDEGFKPDIVTHNIMLEGLLRSKKRSDAIKFFEVIKAKGPSLDVRSYIILIRDLCKQTKMKEAVEYFYEMIDYGFHPDAAVYTCLMTGYGNDKRMDKVYELLKEMKEKGCPLDGKTYNALNKLMTGQRMPGDVVRIYKKMIQNGIEPLICDHEILLSNKKL
jgi:pentatricopeptide repeat protein